MHPAQITLIPLVGEGKVLSRVESFHSLISNTPEWKESLEKADLVFFAAHSQGTPVAVLLLERLIKDKRIHPDLQRVCILGMAGISHGPFPHLKSNLFVKYWEADPARELFEFNDPNSFISITYMTAIQRILVSGAKFVTIGSWYDQVVPLYSAALYGIHHPSVYRALYIDAADYLPDFLSHLVVFSLKLRNCGVADRGLLIHLSQILEGNIYGFGTQGHSALYDEQSTYTMAIAWALISQETPVTLAVTSRFKAPHLSKLNPYHLPWIMAKLLSDDLPAELKSELKAIVDMYPLWEPKTKEAKDLKYRLEALHSKL